MILTCPSCDTRYNLPQDKLSPKGTKVRCTKCGNVFTAYPDGSPDLEEPAPPPPPEPAGDTPSGMDMPDDTDLPGGDELDSDLGMSSSDDDLLASLGGGEETPQAGQEASEDDGLGDLLGGALDDEEQSPADTAPEDNLGDLLGGDLGGDLEDELGGGLDDDQQPAAESPADTDLGGELDGDELGDLLGDLDAAADTSAGDDEEAPAGQEDVDALGGELDDDLSMGDDLLGGLGDEPADDLAGTLDDDAPAEKTDDDAGGDLDFESLLGDLDSEPGAEAPSTPATESEPESPAGGVDLEDMLSGLGGGEDDAPLGGGLADDDELLSPPPPQAPEDTLDETPADSPDVFAGVDGEDDTLGDDLQLSDAALNLGLAEPGAARDEGDGEDAEEAFPSGKDEDVNFDLDDVAKQIHTTTKTKEKKNSLPLIVLGVLLFLVAGGVGALYVLKPALPDWVPESIRNMLGGEETPAEDEASMASPVEQVRLISLTNIRQYVVNNDKAGRLLVVEGKAVNNFDTPKEMVRVQATLLDAQGGIIAQQEVTCGNTLSLFQLQIMGRVEIEASLSSELGILSNNTNLTTGKGVPFMAVFFKPPENVAEYKVDVVGAEDAK